MRRTSPLILLLGLLSMAAVAQAQFGGRFGGSQDLRILQRYDKDGDGMLNARERQAAMSDFGFDTSRAPPQEVAGARKLKPEQVRHYTSESLYDPKVVRTVFLEFDTPTWEDELAVFKNSDVKVPATLKMDGKVYRDVGISFHGQTSFRMVSAGQKRSLNVDINMAHKDQRLLGNKKLALLNSAGDPTFVRSIMYMHIARAYYPALKVNYMRVVINGRDWGIYVNQQPEDAVYARMAGGSDGPIWKVEGSPNGRGGLEYLGDDPAPYQALFELKDKGSAATKADAWAMLVKLCRVLNQTSPDKLPAAISPLLDVDAALRYLAVDNALMNSDGFHSRASDYSLFVDVAGRFGFVAHDVNESLRPIERGGGGWRRREQLSGTVPAPAGSVALDPFAGAADQDKALLYRLLQVPEYRKKYLGYVRDVAEHWLSWEKFGPLAQRYQALIADDVRQDVRKLYTTEAFSSGLLSDVQEVYTGPLTAPGMSLKAFVEQRRDFLLQNSGGR